MKEIINFNEQERQSYVPASVKVIEVTAHGVLCASGDGTQQYSPVNNPDWF